MASKTPGKKISGRFYSFGSSVTPIFLIMNHLLTVLDDTENREISQHKIISLSDTILDGCRSNKKLKRKLNYARQVDLHQKTWYQYQLNQGQ